MVKFLELFRVFQTAKFLGGKSANELVHSLNTFKLLSQCCTKGKYSLAELSYHELSSIFRTVAPSETELLLLTEPNVVNKDSR